MGEVLITRKSQRGGVPPDGFTQPTQILTESGTWTCPRSGTYYISCIGSGGLSLHHMGRAGGGGAGGIAESLLKFAKGTEIEATVDNAVSSFGTFLSATSGQSSYPDVNHNYQPISGSGGTASGGNIGNYDGEYGIYPFDSVISNNKILKLGGDTSSLAKWGQSYGNRCFYDSASDNLFEYTPVRSDMRYSFGGGGRACILTNPTNSNDDSFSAIDYINNGAIIIEYLK